MALCVVSRRPERYKRNLARYNAVPSMPNFVKLLIAEGVLIGDLGWL